MKTLILAAAILAAQPALAQFKCKAPDGSVSFQQNPCAQGQQASKLDLPPPAPDDGRAWARAYVARGEVAPGLTRAEMLQALGQPTKCNTSNVRGTMHDQCIYRRPGYTDFYVYLRNNIVESWQADGG